MKLLHYALGLTAACAVAFFVSPGPQVQASAAASHCLDGRSVGDWHLPSSGQLGFARGFLVESQTGDRILEMDARLIAEPAPCVDCLEGRVEGRLVDPHGVVRYTVRGRYTGVASTGEGTFWVEFFDPTGTTPHAVGRMWGGFSEPPIFPTIGRYEAEWVICG